jgi:hypothetical protein
MKNAQTPPSNICNPIQSQVRYSTASTQSQYNRLIDLDYIETLS